MSLTTDDRNLRFAYGKNLPPARYAAEIAAALRRQYDAEGRGIKTVVRLTGANERTVGNWFSAKNGPSGEWLVVLCGESDEILNTVLRLLGRAIHARRAKIAVAQRTARELCGLLEDLDRDTDGRSEHDAPVDVECSRWSRTSE